ncbi:MAG: biopolymer transporter ExbD [Myxococcales bacterium]|nr:biopolymer transporter ExbD [Myxococcales bacterium]
MSGAASPGLGKKKRIHHVKKTEMLTPRSDINVTPLVDVVLVLLIIFMVITPMMSRGREVKLPKTSNHYQRKDKQQPVVAIDHDTKTDTYPVYYDKEKLGELSEPGVEEKLQEKITRGWDNVKDPESQGRVYVKAAGDIPYVKVYPLLMAINKMGVSSIDLGTNEKEQ